MSHELSMTNVSFKFLEESNEFLNIILNNIQECILILDKKLRLKAFNDSMKTIFSNKKDENLLYVKCGEAIGCAYQIEEAVGCGKTSHCRTCELRISALNSYTNDKTIYNKKITRPFFDHNNKKINKHLRFSTRLFIYNKEKYIIMMVEDISSFIEMEKKLVT